MKTLAIVLLASASTHAQKFNGKCLNRDGWLGIESRECGKMMSIFEQRKMPIQESGVACGNGGMGDWKKRCNNCQCLNLLVNALTKVTGNTPAWGKIEWICVDHDDFGTKNCQGVDTVERWFVAKSDVGDSCDSNTDCWSSGVCRGGYCCDKSSWLKTGTENCKVCQRSNGECGLPTTSTLTVTTTVTSTTNTVLKALHDRLKELEAQGDLKVVVDGLDTLETTVETQAATIASQVDSIASLKETVAAQADQIADLSTQNQQRMDDQDAKMVSALADANAQIDVLMYQFGELMKPVTREPAAVDASRCSSPSECPPSVESTADGDLAMRAAGGKVVFESADCADTDLCELARDVQAIKLKFEE